MSEIALYLLLAAGAGVFLYYNINKLTTKLDIEAAFGDSDEPSKALMNDELAKYRRLCDSIDDELRKIRQNSKSDGYAVDGKLDELLQKLSLASKKLVYLQSTHQNVNRLNQQIAQLLFELDKTLRECLSDGDRVADELRQRLGAAF